MRYRWKACCVLGLLLAGVGDIFAQNAPASRDRPSDARDQKLWSGWNESGERLTKYTPTTWTATATVQPSAAAVVAGQPDRRSNIGTVSQPAASNAPPLGILHRSALPLPQRPRAMETAGKSGSLPDPIVSFIASRKPEPIGKPKLGSVTKAVVVPPVLTNSSCASLAARSTIAKEPVSGTSTR
jgi:hypothetical protein